MSNKPLLSIIVPVFHTEQFLSRCIESIFDQSYKNIEIIVIDDHSTDECANIVKKYQKEYDSIHYIRHTQNKGLLQARITGINYASGKYITSVDSDDYIISDIYSEAINSLEKTNNELFMYNILSDNQQTPNTLQQNEFLTGKYMFCRILIGKNSNFLFQNFVNKIFKASTLKKSIENIDISKKITLAEDLLLTSLFYFSIWAKRCCTISNTQGYIYNFNPNSSTKLQTISNKYKQIFHLHCVLKAISKRIPDSNILPLFQEFQTVHSLIYYPRFNKYGFKNILSFIISRLIFSTYFYKTISNLKQIEQNTAEKLFKKIIASHSTRIYCFGASSVFHALAPLLQHNNITILGLIDNNPLASQLSYNFYHPEELLKLNPEIPIVITNYRHVKTIRHQLMNIVKATDRKINIIHI